MICKLANYVDKNLKKQYNYTLKVITNVYVREKSGTETVTFKCLGTKATHISVFQSLEDPSHCQQGKVHKNRIWKIKSQLH